MKISLNFYEKLGKKAGILLIAVILILVNAIAVRNFVRLDLTEDQQYVISDVSRETVGNLDDILSVKVFFSKKLPPNLAPLSQYVEDILSEYEAYSNGNLRIEYLDPSKEEVATEAKGLGIPEVQMNVLEKDKWQIQKGFLGIALQYLDKTEILPVVQETQNFEYDFTSKVKRLTAEEIKRVAFLTGHKEHSIRRIVPEGEEDTKTYTAVSQELSKNYDLTDVAVDEGEKIENVDTLVVAGPKEKLSERALFEIDQFLMNGGNILFLVDGVELTPNFTINKLDTGLGELLGHYGVALGQDLVLDAVNETVPFNTGLVQFLLPYPFWPKFINQNFSENPIVSKLESVSMSWVSSVFEEPSASHENFVFEELIQTSEAGWVESSDLSIDPNRQFDVANIEQGNQSVMALVSAKFNSFFDGKEVPAAYKENAEGLPEEILGSTDTIEIKSQRDNDGKLVVIGDSDFATDNMLRNFPQNLPLLLNAVDYLTLDSDLISIRSKKVTERPLAELTEGQKTWVKVLGVIGMPVLIILFGVTRSVLRKKKKNQLTF